MAHIINSVSMIADDTQTFEARQLTRLDLSNGTTVIMDGNVTSAYQSLKSGLRAWHRVCAEYEMAGWALTLAE